jgi:hypothetical protein
MSLQEHIRRWAPWLLLIPICGAFYFFFEDIMHFFRPKDDVEVKSQDGRVVEMVTVLDKDGIPSIDNPRFIDETEAERQYGSSELVIGVEIDGDARAYSVPHLSRHEIVNDVVGGQPVAVTW